MCVDLIGNFLFHGRTLPIYLPPPPKHINCFLFLYMPVLVIPRVSVHTVKHGEIKVFFSSLEAQYPHIWLNDLHIKISDDEQFLTFETSDQSVD